MGRAMKYLYLGLTLAITAFNALSLTYIADKYYQLGRLDGARKYEQDLVNLPPGYCLAGTPRDGNC